MPPITLRTTDIEVTLDARWPRILNLRRLDTGGTLDANRADDPFLVECNGQRFGEDQVKCDGPADLTAEGADYELRIAALSLTLRFHFEVAGQELSITLPEVREDGAFRLERLYLPEQRLVAATATAGDSYYVASAGGRHNWTRSWVPGTDAGNFEDLGHVADATPWLAPRPGRGCVWNDRICVAVSTSWYVDNQVVSLETTGQLAPGRAGRCSVWAGSYPYRLRGRLALPYRVQVAVLGDYNGNGRIDWCDGAAWDGDQTARRIDDVYPETILYKVMLQHQNRPAPYRTFAGVLDVIQRIHAVSGGLRQIAYLVGWQGVGHDSCYPAFGPVNEAVGGLAELRKLIADAKRFNCTVSLHINLDDSYEGNAEFRTDLLARGPGERPIVWFPNYEAGGAPVYSINHTLAVETGYARERMERLLALLPIEQSIHCDAHRNVNEAWLADGSHIDRECEVQMGMLPIRRMWLERGIDITVETIDGGGHGLAAWGYHYVWGSLWGTVAGHGRIAGGHRGGLEGEGLGAHWVYPENDPGAWADLTRRFYTQWMYAQILHRKKMLDFRIGTWNEGVEAWYEDETHVVSGRQGAAPRSLEATYEGIAIAHGDERFLPWRDSVICAYSPSGGPQKWTLPAAWEGRPVRAEELLPEEDATAPCEIAVRGREVEFTARPGVPVRLTLVGE